MSERQNSFLSNGKYLFGCLVLLLMAVVCVAFSVTGSDDFEIAKREILIRKVGHELLLQSGDSVSRVLPVNKISADEYQLSFEHEFGFLPDDLVNTTKRLLSNNSQLPDYVVNVFNCGSDKVAYGYVISNNQKNDIISCKGRKLPKACYMITIKFKSASLMTAKSGYLLASVPILAFIGLLIFRYVKPKKKPQELPQGNDLFQLGAFSFDAKNRKLTLNEVTIDLTATEAKVLHIFALLSPNVAIERNRIQKEIWEDEGVIVGRSLDMFISKLRKKLELDANVTIAVVRGKGYKLEISA